MGLVYEMSPAAEKEELVKLLVGTLMEGRKYVNLYENINCGYCIECKSEYTPIKDL